MYKEPAVFRIWWTQSCIFLYNIEERSSYWECTGGAAIDFRDGDQNQIVVYFKVFDLNVKEFIDAMRTVDSENADDLRTKKKQTKRRC